jgi:hypothetical protein
MANTPSLKASTLEVSFSIMILFHQQKVRFDISPNREFVRIGRSNRIVAQSSGSSLGRTGGMPERVGSIME